MSDELNDFEKQLRRMSPVSCDHLKDDAMYRAGWDAAHAALALRSQTAMPKRKSIGTFAKGLVCGVMCCGVSLMAWQSGEVDQSRPQESVTVLNDIFPPADAVANSATVSGDDALAVQPQNALSSFSALLVPWLNSSDAYSVVTPSAAKPLSIAARRQWSRMVMSDGEVLVVHQAPKETTSDDEQKFPCLRTRPLRDMNINDLM